VTDPGPQRLGFWWIAEDHPELPAILASPSGPRSFGELAEQAHRIVHALRGAGLERGGAVAALLPNDCQLVEWLLACEQSGLHLTMINPRSSSDEIEAVLEASEASALVFDASNAEALSGIARCQGLRALVSVGEVPGITSVDAFLEPHPATIPEERSPGAFFAFSSGTTGRAKGIKRRLREGDPSELAHEAALTGRAFSLSPLRGSLLMTAGMFHGGSRVFYMAALNMGQAVVIHPRFDAEKMLKAIQEHRVTTVYAVPVMFHRLLKLPEATRAAYDVSSLEVVVHGAAPCPPSVKHRMMHWWGPVLWETYGGTEGAATIAKPYRWLEKPGTVGRSVRGVTVTIRDDNGGLLPPGEVGEVFIDTGERLFRYTGDPAQTDEVFQDTAFTIGDLGYLDEDGYLFLADRKKDMIISGGVNVYPSEIENVLATHPAVADTAVVGIPDDEWGEQVKAVVEPVVAPATAAEMDSLENELIALCREKLAPSKCPRSVDFVGELPRSDTGKVLKREIRDRYWADSGRRI